MRRENDAAKSSTRSQPATCCRARSTRCRSAASMAEVFGALLPTFILIALGFTARATQIATAEQFGMVNRFGYFILYPSFLFTLISGANFASGDAGGFLLGVVGGFLAL